MTEPRRSGRSRRSVQSSLNEAAMQAELLAAERRMLQRSRMTRQQEIEDEQRRAMADAQQRPQEEDDDDLQQEQEEDDDDAEEEEEEADETERRAARRAPQKARTKPRARAADRDAARRGEEAENEDEEEGEEGGSEATAAATPARRRGRVSTASSSSRTPSSRRNAAADAPPAPEEKHFSSLWQAVARSSAAVRHAVSAWLDAYRHSLQRRREAQKELVNFLLECCGAAVGLTVTEVRAADGVEAMQELLSRYEDEDLMLNAEPPVRRIRKLDGRLREFMRRLYEEAGVELLEDDAFFHAVVPSLVSVFSRSAIRAYRLTMSIAYVGMSSGIISLAAELDRQLSTARQQLEVAESRKPRPSVALVGQLRSSVDELQSSLSALHSLLKQLFASVFVHRYRDVDEHIRAMQLQALCRFIIQYPQLFLDDSFLKYCGWTLHDKSALVRRSSAQGLLQLYRVSTAEMLQRLELFTARFMKRLSEMCEDVDDAVSGTVIELFVALLKLGLLDTEQGRHIPVLLWDESPTVRKAAAQFVLAENFSTARSSEEEQKQQEGGAEERHEEDLHQLVALFTACCPLVTAQQRRTAGRRQHEPAHVREVPLGRQLLVQAGRVSELQDADYQQSMDVLVDALWPSLPALRDWQALHRMIVAGEEEQQAEAAGAARAGKRRAKVAKAAAGSEGQRSVSDEMKLCLLYALVSCAKRATRAGSEAKDSKKAQEEREEQTAALSIFLISHLPSMLSIAVSSPVKIRLLLQLFAFVRLEQFALHRRRDSFLSLLSLLKRITASSVSDRVLHECGRCWRQLVREQESYAEDATHALDELVTELKERLRSLWDDAAGDGSQDTAARAAQDIVDDRETATTLLALLRRIVALCRPLSPPDLVYTSAALHHVYHELLPTLADGAHHTTVVQQELLLCLLHLLYSDIVWRMAELDRSAPARPQLERLVVLRNDLVSLLHGLLEHSVSWYVKDAVFALCSDAFVLFNGRLQGGVMTELVLNRERLNTLSAAFTDYFLQMMDGHGADDRLQQETMRRAEAEDGPDSEAAVEETDDAALESFVADLRVQAMLAASHVIVYDQSSSRADGSGSASTFSSVLRHPQLTASFFSQYLTSDADVLSILKQTQQLLRGEKGQSFLLLLAAQRATLVHLFEHHAEPEQLRLLSSRLALSHPITHASFAPMLRSCIAYALRDPPLHLPFLEAVVPWLQRSSKADAQHLLQLWQQAREAVTTTREDAAAARSPSEEEKEAWAAFERFEAALLKKAGVASIGGARRLEDVAEAERAEGDEAATAMTTPRRRRRTGPDAAAAAAAGGDISLALTPGTHRTPLSAESGRSGRSIVSLGLSPVREAEEEGRHQQQQQQPVGRKRERQPMAEEEEAQDAQEADGGEAEAAASTTRPRSSRAKPRAAAGKGQKSRGRKRAVRLVEP